MPRTMPFGFARGFVAQVPAPKRGMTVTSSGYSEAVEFENGGAAVVDSAGKHLTFGMQFSGSADALNGIDIFRQFASGLYGRGLIDFSDPMNYDTNLLPAHWATPHLAELGWKHPLVGVSTYTDRTPTSSVPYRRLSTTVMAMDANATPVHRSKLATILIPPTHTLWLGFTGQATGTSVLRARPISVGGAFAATSDVPLGSPANPMALTTSFSGALYQAVEIYGTRTSTEASTLALVSGMAQLHRTGVNPFVKPLHIPGMGNTGVRFADGAIPETYQMTKGHYKQLSTNLIEVGAWG